MAKDVHEVLQWNNCGPLRPECGDRALNRQTSNRGGLSGGGSSLKRTALPGNRESSERIRNSSGRSGWCKRASSYRPCVSGCSSAEPSAHATTKRYGRCYSGDESCTPITAQSSQCSLAGFAMRSFSCRWDHGSNDDQVALFRVKMLSQFGDVVRLVNFMTRVSGQLGFRT